MWQKNTLFAVGFALITAFSASMTLAADKRPNILLIVGDDIGYGDLGFTGAITQTPNIDTLASAGVAFTRFHASPVCSISRAMLLTGNDPIEIGLAAFDYALYPPANGAPGYESYLTRTTVTIAELLQESGYRTYMTGKWHLGGAHGGEGPHQWGFDHSYSIYTGGANHWNQGVFHIDTHNAQVMELVKQNIIPTEPYYEDGESVTRPTGIFSDTLWSGKMLEYLESERDTGKPFFAYLAFTTAHAPLQAPGFLVDKYTDHFLESGFAGLRRQRWEMQKRMGLIDADVPYVPYEDNKLVLEWNALSDEAKQRQARSMAVYSAMMESQDYHIGTVLNYLRETGELENTLVIYMSDNGPEGQDVEGRLGSAATKQWIEANFSTKISDIGRGNAFGFMGTSWASASTGSLQWWKWFIGEGGIRVPLIVVPPANQAFARAGAMTADHLSVKDLPITILDYAGVKHPMTKFKDRTINAPSGVSMRPYLEGKRSQPRTEEQWVAFELFGNGFVVSGEYKAIRVRPAMWGDGQWHLYNIVKDPGETRDLANEQPDRLKKLAAIYDNWAESNGIVAVEDNWSPWHGFLTDEQMQDW
jgi:arylsulfatase